MDCVPSSPLCSSATPFTSKEARAASSTTADVAAEEEEVLSVR